MDRTELFYRPTKNITQLETVENLIYNKISNNEINDTTIKHLEFLQNVLHNCNEPKYVELKYKWEPRISIIHSLNIKMNKKSKKTKLKNSISIDDLPNAIKNIEADTPIEIYTPIKNITPTTLDFSWKSDLKASMIKPPEHTDNFIWTTLPTIMIENNEIPAQLKSQTYYNRLEKRQDTLISLVEKLLFIILSPLKTAWSIYKLGNRITKFGKLNHQSDSSIFDQLITNLNFIINILIKFFCFVGAVLWLSIEEIERITLPISGRASLIIDIILSILLRLPIAIFYISRESITTKEFIYKCYRSSIEYILLRIKLVKNSRSFKKNKKFKNKQSHLNKSFFKMSINSFTNYDENYSELEGISQRDMHLTEVISTTQQIITSYLCLSTARRKEMTLALAIGSFLYAKIVARRFNEDPFKPISQGKQPNWYSAGQILSNKEIDDLLRKYVDKNDTSFLSEYKSSNSILAEYRNKLKMVEPSNVIKSFKLSQESIRIQETISTDCKNRAELLRGILELVDQASASVTNMEKEYSREHEDSSVAARYRRIQLLLICAIIWMFFLIKR